MGDGAGWRGDGIFWLCKHVIRDAFEQYAQSFFGVWLRLDEHD